ncbi:MAG TPA: PilN domain-containing protein [Chthoniobacterales bacterium]|nr:PilN domain-containing protein [Chthoniobacterales bacterium]
MRGLATLEEAGTLLAPGDDFVLGLPVAVVLAQRLRLPTVERDEFVEMVRIQIEKAMPYSTDEMTTAFEVISQTEEGSVISAVAVHNEKLSELAAPLLALGLIPGQVTVYAAQRAVTHAPVGIALLIYPEEQAIVCAIAEEGKLSFTRTLDAADPLQLQRDLPQLALSAELQGINTSFPKILLDESLFGLRDTVQGIFATDAEFVAVEVPPADTALNLLPESWRQRRAQVVRQGEWRKRLIWAGAAYAALLVLFLAFLLVVRFQIRRLDKRIQNDTPRTEFVKMTAAKWKALSPAIDPHYYPIEVLQHLADSLPSEEVRITKFDQSARQISVEGEANTAALAYQFADKVKKKPELQMFQIEMAAPKILPNDHAQFRLEAKSR